MLYTAASEQWSADSPLTPAQSRVGLFRTRDEAGKLALAEGQPTLAVAVRYDATRATIVATTPASLRLDGGSWSAPAFLNDSGGVVPLCPIPPALVKRVGPPRFRVHAPQPTAVACPSARGSEAQFERPPVRSAVAGRVFPRR